MQLDCSHLHEHSTTATCADTHVTDRPDQLHGILLADLLRSWSTRHAREDQTDVCKAVKKCQIGELQTIELRTVCT